MSALLHSWTVMCNPACWRSRQIGTNLDRGGQANIIYLDRSKSFDKVNHAKLLRKLHEYFFGGGGGGDLRTWLESYLRVTSLGATSSPLPVTSEVPHGSILGPMLFRLYLNSLPDVVRPSQIAAFANDAKIFKEITATRNTEKLQEDLLTWSSGQILLA